MLKSSLLVGLPRPDAVRSFNWNSSKTTILASSALVGLAFVYAGKIWYSYGFFRRRGIKTPQIKFLTGNFDEIEENSYSETLMKWTKELGSTYGYFEGHTPVLVTSDLEIIQEIFIKDYFVHFSGRKMMPYFVDDKDDILNMAFSSKNRWKRMRTIINPTFSPARLKELVPILKICSDRLLTVIENNTGRELDLTDIVNRMTMDAVMNCLFGMEVNVQNSSEKNIYMEKMQLVISQTTELPLFIKTLIFFPEIKRLVIGLSQKLTNVAYRLGFLGGEPFYWLTNKVEEIINQRTKSNKTRKDYMQILLESVSSDTKNSSDQVSDISLVQKKISVNEIKTNLLAFLGAGTETTSSTITSSIYILATMPDEQAKLREEIAEHIDSIDQMDCESLNKCEYLDLFIKETLRMFSIGNTFVNRRCVKSTTVKGIQVPEDLVIAVDVMSIHFNPEYWGSVDPYEFYPERFLDPTINKMAYMPFGLGPRTCVGMKFALLQIKLTLVKILKLYEILPASSTPSIKTFSQSFRETILVRKTWDPVPVVFKRI